MKSPVPGRRKSPTRETTGNSPTEDGGAQIRPVYYLPDRDRELVVFYTAAESMLGRLPGGTPVAVVEVDKSRPLCGARGSDELTGRRTPET
ncbi:MAG TPA: hypothetical protein VFW71_15770 [Actinomycetota bacterium]|nr:hypothetical protein [Actinomycetota bacterium]